jgi:PAS domain S-box-containing protein
MLEPSEGTGPQLGAEARGPSVSKARLRLVREGAASLFSDEPSRLRRLVLVLYLAVGPVFAAVLTWLSAPARLAWSLGAVVGLIGSGLLVLGLVRAPGRLAWLWVGVVVPEVSCGLAAFAVGGHGPAFVAVLGAPIAWSMVLFDEVISLGSFVVSLPICFTVVALAAGVPEAAGNTLVFGTIFGLVTWVGRSKGAFLRDARDAANAERRRMAALLGAVPDVVARADDQGRFLDLSVPRDGQLPQPREQLIGKSVYQFVPPEVAAEIRLALARALSTGEVQRVEYAAHYPTGTRWFESRFVRSGAQEVLVVRQDITSAYRSREERELLGALEQNMVEAVVVVGLDQRVLQWSPGATALSGWSAFDSVGKPISTFVPGGDTQVLEAIVALERGERYSRTNTWRRKDGVEVTSETSFGLLRDLKGSPRAVLAVSRDVTAALTERARELEVARLQSLGQRMNEVEFVFRPDGQMVHANDQALATYGYSREELLALNVRQLRAPDTGALVAEQMREALTRGVRFETIHQRKDGTRFPVEISSCGVTVDGEVYLHTLARDLTRQRATEQALRDSEARLQSIFSVMAEGVVLQDGAGKVIDSNDAAARILGLTRPQLEGRTPLDPRWVFVHEDGTPIGDAEHPSLVTLRTGVRQAGIIMGLRSGQGTRWLSISADPLCAPGEVEPYAVVTTFADITELRRGQELVRVSEGRLQRVFQGSRDGFFDWDLTTGVVTRSARVFEMLGVPPVGLEATVAGLLGIMHPEDAPRMSAALLAVAAGESPQLDEEFRVKAGDGSSRWLHGRARRSGDAGHATVSGAVTDVTEKHDDAAKLAQSAARNAALVEELRAATLAAQRANQLKGQFLATMSHEIRTPLNAILGLSMLGLEEESPAKVRDYVKTIHHSGAGLLAIVNDILDFAKFEAGKLVLERIPFDLRGLVDEVVGTFETTAETRGLRLSRALAADLPSLVVGDPLRTRQVLTNLLSNALKFTERGEVEVSASRCAGVGATITVRDTGLGMSGEQVQHLFESFTQADATMTRRFGGTGLGLAISRNLARAMGGELTATSALGVGSTFVFTLAVAVPTEVQHRDFVARQPDAPLVRPATLVGRRVLVAEDNTINQLLARTLLEKAGVQVTVVDNGRKAADAVLAAPRAFDAVLMDIQMPELDGLEATRLIRQGLGAEAPPIIAMTANAMSEQRDQSLAAGMVEHVTKPIDPRALYAVLARFVDRAPAS